MQLESVRALKEELLQTAISDPVSSRVLERAVSPGDKELSPADAIGMEVAPDVPPSAIALGIANDEGGDYRLAVRVQHLHEMRGSKVKMITEAAAGEVDVRYTGRPKPAAGGDWHRHPCDPLRSGVSLGSRPQKTTGTLGCFVERADSGDLALISAAHVLAGWGRGKKGDEIIQPGWEDGRRGRNPAIADLTESVDLGSLSTDEDDCALAVLRDGGAANPVRGLAADGADLDEPVQKEGRTTGHTKGRVLAIEIGPLEIEYPKVGRLQFDNLIEVDGREQYPFAARGDSGSVVIAAEQRALGLLFSVTGRGGRNGRGVSYLAPLDRVLHRLQARLVP